MTQDTVQGQQAPSAGWAGLKRHWGWMLALGILWIILGSLAIIMPFAATLAFELVLGGLLAFGGIAQVIQAFGCRGWRGFAMHLLGGILALVIGVFFLFFPIQGVLTVTLLLGAYFLAAGAFKIVTAIQHRTVRNWGWVMFSGLLSIAIGLVIWFAWPGSAIWVLGILVGVEFIFTGWSMVMLALSARHG
jgi:uncharacterized membrane protein HdeD (DUF308 family)